MATATDPVVTPAPTFAGFDTSIYPGDQKMTTWKQSSPYVFVGYYLSAPCHGKSSWMGQRAALIGMGWNLLPIYVGQQVVGASKCKSNILTAAQGQTDGDDASAKMAAEGFPASTFVYLDVERTETFPSALGDYITAWVAQVASGDYNPSVYCHKHNADDARAAVLAGLSDPPAADPRFWIVGGVTSHFHTETSKPTDVGVAFANIWQRPAQLSRTFGGVTINPIDEDVAQWADPAAPDAA
ncbi:MAG TPA: glycoside hydrolase domain-containing protein [Bryobacteraceae bacterium]|nr:glycoside hydrolase domain-containing protein [Bryobacteraceae bacterium]